MQPLITIENVEKTIDEVIGDIGAWRKEMIHYIKEENPEINTAIIEAANQTDLDPKAVALGAYMTYALIEIASKEDALMSQEG